MTMWHRSLCDPFFEGIAGEASHSGTEDDDHLNTGGDDEDEEYITTEGRGLSEKPTRSKNQVRTQMMIL